jgi:DNA-binding transcriptional regulator YiaG
MRIAPCQYETYSFIQIFLIICYTICIVTGMNGKELKEKRKELELTQEQLATELKVTSNTVARWERDEMKIPPFLHLALETIHRNLSHKSHKK